MNTNYLYSDTDWLIYADYLEEQGLTNFIREDVLEENIPWIREWRSVGVVSSPGSSSISFDGGGSDSGGGAGAGSGSGFGNGVGVSFSVSGVGFDVGVGE